MPRTLLRFRPQFRYDSREPDETQTEHAVHAHQHVEARVRERVDRRWSCREVRFRLAQILIHDTHDDRAPRGQVICAFAYRADG
jgi:hypothetical protein